MALRFNHGSHCSALTDDAACSLTDPINRTDEIISMSIDVRGTVPGNRFDVTPYVSLSAYNDSFTSNNTFSYRRSITINITGGYAFCLRHQTALAAVQPNAGKQCASETVAASLSPNERLTVLAGRQAYVAERTVSLRVS